MAVIDRLKQVLAVSSDTELCALTDTNKQTLSNWKSRDSVPYTLCVQIADEKGVSLDWLLSGVGQIYRNQPVTETVITTATGLPPRQQALLDLFNALPEERQREAFSALEDKKRFLMLEKNYNELRKTIDSIKTAG